MLVGILRMIFSACKGGMGRSRLNELEKRILGVDCSGGCMHK